MAIEPQPVVRRRNRLGLLVWAMLVVVVAVALGGLGAYRHFGDPQRICALVTDRIERSTNGRVQIGAATFSFLDGVHLRRLAVSEPNATPGDPPVFQCDEVVVRHDRLAALLGRFQAQSVTVHGATLDITVDPEALSTNLDSLIESYKRRPRLSSSSRPIVDLRQARIRLFEGNQHMAEFPLSVRARPTPMDRDNYDIVWQSAPSDDAAGHAQLHVRNGTLRNVRGGSPTVSTNVVMLIARARSAETGEWNRILGLGGQVRLRDFDLVLRDDSPQSGRRAVLEVLDAHLSVPVDAEERELPAGERFLQFEDVQGDIELEGADVQARLRGRLRGAECSVTATLRGPWTAEDLELEAEVRAAGLELPRWDESAPSEAHRAVRRLPALERFFHNYDPHGRIDLHVEAAKPAGADQKIKLRRLVATALGGDAWVKHFPYRGYDLTGALEYTPDGVWIRQICGEHGGGRVCVSGHFERPNRCAPGEIHVAASDIPIDDDLFAALGSRYQLARDRLRLQGRFGAGVELRRSACEGDRPAKWTWESSVALQDAAASLTEFPYPIEHLHGSVSLGSDRIDLLDVVGRAANADVRIGGNVRFDRPDSPRVDVTLSTSGAAFDEALLAPLPEKLREPLNALQPSGPFDLRANFKTDESGERIVARTQIDLRGVTIRHRDFPVDIADVTGAVTIGPDRIEAPSLVARYGDARLDFAVTLGGRQEAALEATIRAKGLIMDQALRDAAPPAVRGALADWEMLGPIDTAITLRRAEGADRPLDYRVHVQLDGIGVKHAAFPQPFTTARGRVDIEPGRIRAEGLQARYGRASMQLDFDGRNAEGGSEGTIAVDAKNVLLDETLRAALPDGLRRAWDQADPSGWVDVRLNGLHYRKMPNAQPTTWTVDGHVELHEVSFGVAKLSGISGAWVTQGALVDASGAASLSGRVQLRKAVAYDRILTGIDSQWSYARAADGRGRFALERANGALYDGVASGDLELVLGPAPTQYNANLTIHGLQVGPFLDAGRTQTDTFGEDATVSRPGRVRGTADATFYLGGEMGQPLSRRGGGRVEIREGYIYRLPILLAILNVLRMSPPADSVLHDAEAEFYIMGNDVTFQDLELRGGVLALVGSGSMSIPDQAVDLRLVNIGSRHISRIPLLADFVEGASRELVELRVTGPLSHPTVHAQPLRGLTDELRKLFQKKPKKRVPPTG